MNYITTINNFWTRQLTAPVSSGATALFFYLLHQANLRRWQLPMTITNRLIIAELRISKSSFLRYRSELAQNGYIDYHLLGNMAGYSYAITANSPRRNPSEFDTASDIGDTACDTPHDTAYDTTYDTAYDTAYDAQSGVSSYNKTKNKNINIDYKEKRFYNKKYNDKEIYNSGRYDFEEIERIARQRIKESLKD